MQIHRARTLRQRAGDAFLRGEACERVGCLAAAELLYERAAASDASALAPRASLSRLKCRCGDVSAALDGIAAALTCLEALRPSGAPAGVPLSLQADLAALVHAAGMAAVQAGLEEAGDAAHPALGPLSEEVFEWGTDGCEE